MDSNSLIENHTTSINKNNAYLYSKTSPLHYQLTQYNLTGWLFEYKNSETKVKKKHSQKPKYIFTQIYYILAPLSSAS